MSNQQLYLIVPFKDGEQRKWCISVDPAEDGGFGTPHLTALRGSGDKWSQWILDANRGTIALGSDPDRCLQAPAWESMLNTTNSFAEPWRLQHCWSWVGRNPLIENVWSHNVVTVLDGIYAVGTNLVTRPARKYPDDQQFYFVPVV